MPLMLSCASYERKLIEIGYKDGRVVQKPLDSYPRGVVSLGYGAQWFRTLTRTEFTCYDGTILMGQPIYETGKTMLGGKNDWLFTTIIAIIYVALVVLLCVGIAGCSWLAEPAFPPDPNYTEIMKNETGPVPPRGGGVQRPIPWPDTGRTLVIIKQYE